MPKKSTGNQAEPAARQKRPGGVTGNGFRPGQSGNPGGKPKELSHVRELARGYGPDAVHKLAELAGLAVDEAGNRKPGADSQAVQVAAVEALLNRGFGRPEMAVTVRRIHSIQDLTEDELRALVGEDAR